ncbi:hypothetical protein GOBAR_DD18139 [Gossypium barbadense]|nr:hypothetical protein GOBAR_DD18139 [Gossypium barbadense]
MKHACIRGANGTRGEVGLETCGAWALAGGEEAAALPAAGGMSTLIRSDDHAARKINKKIVYVPRYREVCTAWGVLSNDRGLFRGGVCVDAVFLARRCRCYSTVGSCTFSHVVYQRSGAEFLDH